MKKPFFIFFLVVIAACSKEEMPKDILSKEKMAKMLIEVHLLEAKIQKLYLPRDSSMVLFEHYEDMLFDSLMIDRETYDRSLIYYFNNTEKLSDIYDEVLDSLLNRQKTLMQ